MPGSPGGGLWHSGPGSPPVDTMQCAPLHLACAPPHVPRRPQMSFVDEQLNGSYPSPQAVQSRAGPLEHSMSP
eukprot:SAG31_NODE_46533_length_254_cov_0.664516_1_plen_72_part_10